MDRSKQEINKDLMLEVCSLFFDKHWGAEKIAAEMKKRGVSVNRESVYRHLRKARERGYIKFLPPRDRELSARLREKFRGAIHVINTGQFAVNSVLADAAAALVAEKIRDRGKLKKDAPVHIGFTGGVTTRNVAYELSQQYKNDLQLPNLVIHAITGGFGAREAQLAPDTWFAWFLQHKSDEPAREVSFVGLFAPPMVTTSTMYEEIKDLPGVAEAFQDRSQIEIVVTSLGTADDPWIPFVEEGRKSSLMEQTGWVGNVLYCPYSKEGPIDEAGLEWYPFTLFRIPELVEMAAGGKTIVLVCGPSHRSNRRKTAALLPLLMNPKLRVFTDLVIDVGTAQEVIMQTSGF